MAIFLRRVAVGLSCCLIVLGALVAPNAPKKHKTEVVATSNQLALDRTGQAQIASRNGAYPKLTLTNLPVVTTTTTSAPVVKSTLKKIIPRWVTSKTPVYHRPVYHAPAPPVYAGGIGGVFACIRHFESGGNYAEDTGNGYYGAYQFRLSTWQGIGGVGYPDDASPATQDAMAQKLQREYGWGQWSTHSMCGV